MTTAGPHEERHTVEIPEAEKIAAQWEARHDIAARRDGRRHLGVQDYLAHERTEEARHQAEHPYPQAAAPPPEPAPLVTTARHRRSWLRWLHRG